MNCKDQDDPYLVEAVKKSFLIKPDYEKPYNFDVPLNEIKLQGQSELPQDVDDLIFKNNFENGFFIEAGATDGQTNSNTLFFELERNWTGLLVEPMPYNIAEKNRRSYVSPVCLSTKTTPEIVLFDVHALRDKNNSPISMGGIIQDDTRSGEIFKLQCFPLYTLLLAMGNPTVNYFILDIEGAELQVRFLLFRIVFVSLNVGVENNSLGQGGHRGIERGDRPGREGDGRIEAGDH